MTIPADRLRALVEELLVAVATESGSEKDRDRYNALLTAFRRGDNLHFTVYSYNLSSYAKRSPVQFAVSPGKPQHLPPPQSEA